MISYRRLSVPLCPSASRVSSFSLSFSLPNPSSVVVRAVVLLHVTVDVELLKVFVSVSNGEIR
jgi:hypothetical protein